MMGKISKWSVALAFGLALAMLAGSLSPTSFIDGFTGFFHQSQLLGASCTTQLSYNQGLSRLMEWLGLSLVAILVGLAWATIGQVLSGAFGGQKYNQFVKNMLWGGVETAALLGILAGFFMLPLGQGNIMEYGNNRLETARAYTVIAKNTVMFDFGLMLGANMMAGFVTNMNPYFKLPGKVFMTLGFQLAPMFKPIIDILGVTMQLITTSFVMWSAQEFLLCFVQGYMLVILLPAGFFLRGFGLNAGGNALIGIALSMYFVYPQMMIMLGGAVANQLEGELHASGVPNSHIWGTQCLDKPICCAHNSAAAGSEASIPNGDASNGNLSVAQINSGVFSSNVFSTGTLNGGPNLCIYNTFLANAYKATFGALSGSGLLKVAVGAATLGPLFKYMNISWMTAGAMVPLFAFSLYAISEMVFFVFILTMLIPIFIIFVTLTIAKEIAKVLGTEIDLSSLEKLI